MDANVVRTRKTKDGIRNEEKLIVKTWTMLMRRGFSYGSQSYSPVGPPLFSSYPSYNNDNDI